MSFPSIGSIAKERGFSLKNLSAAEAEAVLVEAVKRDCPEAVFFLHRLAHESAATGNPVPWLQDPNSKIGKQLIRIHASDAVRPLVEEHICHGKRLTFVNCCGGVVGGEKPKEKDPKLLLLQIASQAGPIAYADC